MTFYEEILSDMFTVDLVGVNLDKKMGGKERYTIPLPYGNFSKGGAVGLSLET